MGRRRRDAFDTSSALFSRATYTGEVSPSEGVDRVFDIGDAKAVQKFTKQEGAPKPVKEGVSKEEAEAAKTKLVDAGATADVK